MIEELLIATLQNACMATVLAIVIAAVTRRTAHPRLAQILWMLVLLKLVVPPIIEVPVMWIGKSEHALQTDIATDVEHRSLPDVPSQTSMTIDRKLADTDGGAPTVSESIQHGTTVGDASRDVAAFEHGATNPSYQLLGPSIVTIWFVGALFLLASTLSRCASVARLVRRSSLAPSSLKADVENMAEEMGFSKTPTIRVSSACLAPFVCSFGRRPTLLLPAGLLTVMTPEEQSIVIRHELVHLRRYDHLLTWFEVVIVCLYWWHPVAWIAHRRSRQAAELCCDADVLANGQDSPHAYAQTLLKTLDFISTNRQHAVALSSFLNGNVRHIRERLEMILQERKPEPHRLRTRLSIAFLALAVLVTTPVLLTADGEGRGDPENDSPSSSRLLSDADETAIIEGEGQGSPTRGVEGTGSSPTGSSSDGEASWPTVAELTAGLRELEQSVRCLSVEYAVESSSYHTRPGEPLPEKILKEGLIRDDAVACFQLSQVAFLATSDGRYRTEVSTLSTDRRFDRSQVHRTLVRIAAFDRQKTRAMQIEIAADGSVNKFGRTSDRRTRFSPHPFDFTINHVGTPISEILISLGGQVVDLVTWEEATVYVVETPSFTREDGYTSKRRYWIDPERNFVVVRRQILEPQDNGRQWTLHHQIDCREHKEVHAGIWLPTQVETINNVVPDHDSSYPVRKNTLSVSNWRVNDSPDADEFLLELPDSRESHAVSE